MRDLSLLTWLASHCPQDVTLYLTEYIARHELSLVSREIQELERNGKLTVVPVARKSPAFEQARALKRQGFDAGEAEAIGWLMNTDVSPLPLFITNDRKARDGANGLSVPAGDVMDVIVEVIDSGLLSESDAADYCSPWSDRSQSLCKPRDFTTFEALLKQRRGRGSLRAP